jgi:F-type H+-transporting ATPase subunit b
MHSTFVLASLIEPGIGLIFWTSLTFILLLVILGKFAWKPILGAIRTREENISKALASAESALKDMRELRAANETILQQARTERDNILKEAREAKDSIIAEARQKAQSESDRILSSARDQIANEKNAAVAELKKQVAVLSIEIAEKILKSELSNDEKQRTLVSTLMKDVNLN